MHVSRNVEGATNPHLPVELGTADQPVDLFDPIPRVQYRLGL